MNTTKYFCTIILLAAVVTMLSHLAATTTANAGILGRFFDQTGCCARCPACDYVCKLDAEKGEEDRICFDIETKVVCIPRVVFPWQKRDCTSCSSCDGNGCSVCVNNGATARKVCVLKPSSYQCPKCNYSWSAEKKGCSRGCPDGSCACDGVIRVDPILQSEPALQGQPASVEDQPIPVPALSAPKSSETLPPPKSGSLPIFGTFPLR